MAFVERCIFYLLLLFLPTQLGKHFWPDFSIVSGIRIDYLSPTLHVTDMLLVLLFAISFSRFLRTVAKSDKRKEISKKYWLVGILIGVFFIVNIFFSLRPLLSFYGLAKFVECVFFSFYIAKTITSFSLLQQVAALFAVSSFFESIIAILQYVHQGSLNGIFYFFGERLFTGTTPGIANASLNGVIVLRPYGTFPHPNVLAGFLLISMVLVWSLLFKHTKHWVQIFVGVSLVFSSTALLLTFSRIAILLWTVLVFALLFREANKRLKTLKAKFLSGALLFAVLVVLSSFPLIHDLFIRFAQTSLTDESVTVRTELLSTATLLIEQHPLVGVGLYNFIPAMAPLQRPLPLGLYLQPVHNIFVLITAETGLVGFGIFLWLLVLTMKKINRHDESLRMMLIVLVLIIICTGLVDHYWLTLQQGKLLVAFVFGLSWTHVKKSV